MNGALWTGLVIGLAIDIYIAWWVYTDAKKRGANATLWGISAFLFSVITLIIWMFKRSNRR